MEPQCTTGPEDRLSRLPAELLTRIFELAYEDEHTTTGPLSRALLPYDRIERFKVVEVNSKKQLKRLMKLFKAIPFLPSFVEHFAYSAAKLPMSFRPDLFFASFSRLTSLHVDGPSGLFDLVLSAAFVRLCPPRLAKVSLGAPSDWVSPGNPEHFQHPCSIPSITFLTLDVRGVYNDSLDAHQPEGPTRLHHLTDLAIRAENNDLDVYASLSRACPALKAIHIDDDSDEPDFRGVLDELPSTLEELSLKTITCFDTYSAPCDHLLPRFTQLKHLYFGEGIFSHDTLFSNLRLLASLARFTLGLGAVVDASDLLSFVSGSTRHPSLKLLVLDMLNKGVRGYRLIQDGNGLLHPEGTAETSRVAPDWRVPEFTGLSDGVFSVEAVEQLVLAGAQTGIRVEGSAVKGIDFYREWMSEATDCLIACGRQERNYGELRDFLGDEAAEQVLRERGIEV